MKKTCYVLLAVLAVSFLGCAPPNEQIKKLANENALLISTLETANNNLDQLGKENSLLSEKLEYQLSVNSSLSVDLSEKRSENIEVKKTVRDAIKEQFRALTSLMGNENLLNVIGSELVKRKEQKGKNLTLIDPVNSIRTAGTLVGGYGYFNNKTRFNVLLLRPVEEGIYVIVHESQVFEVESEGITKFTFESPLNVDAGDLIGYKFTGDVTVPYDIGTGSTGYLPDLTSKQVKISNLEGKSDKRNYSLRVVGLLD